MLTQTSRTSKTHLGLVRLPGFLVFTVLVWSLTLAMAGLSAVPALGAQVTLAWDANTEPHLAGYRIYYGPASRTYTQNIDVGKQTRRKLTVPGGSETVYFAVTAYDIFGRESGFSEEVRWPIAWKTEIGVINTAASAMSGTLRGFNASGSQVWMRHVSLGAHGRTELDVTTAAGASASQIMSMRLDIARGQAVGYQKFHETGRRFRVGLEASPRANQESLFVPHIASNNEWWTGIGWLNTTGAAKNLQFAFDAGQTATKALGPGGHDAFTIACLFGGRKQPGIGAAQVSGGAGMVGLMLFGGDRVLSGVSLSDTTATTLHFPHVAHNHEWWTGLVVYNPGSQIAGLSMVYRDAQGNQLGTGNARVGPGQKMVGLPDTLGFPPGTQWFSVQSTQPVTGFELFGTMDRKQLAGYSVVNLASTSGVFPKLERSGWTGIAFVNTGASATVVRLEARNNAGNVVAIRNMSLAPGQKSVAVAEDLFAQSIARATYIRFTSNQPLVGFQLNGSFDGTMLDGIPALGRAHVGTQRLYFPHIAAQ